MAVRTLAHAEQTRAPGSTALGAWIKCRLVKTMVHHG
jgi:hypothetical protein